MNRRPNPFVAFGRSVSYALFIGAAVLLGIVSAVLTGWLE